MTRSPATQDGMTGRCATRDSIHQHAAAATAATLKLAMARPDSQPAVPASTIPNTRDNMASVSVTAPPDVELACRGAGHVPVHGDPGHRQDDGTDRNVNEEDPAPRQGQGQQPAKEHAQPAADAAHRCPGADRPALLLALCRAKTGVSR